jgi:predicted GNAT family N-acyltransferase
LSVNRESAAVVSGLSLKLLFGTSRIDNPTALINSLTIGTVCVQEGGVGAGCGPEVMASCQLDRRCLLATFNWVVVIALHGGSP